MSFPNRTGDEKLDFRLGRLAGCLERLLEPGSSGVGLDWLIQRVLGIQTRLAGNELLPLTGFRTENQANAIWEQLAVALDEHGLGPSNVRTDVDATFEELALNATQHSQTMDTCYGIVEMVGPDGSNAVDQPDGEILYIVGISDGGIGIPDSLRKNPAYAGITNDKDAIIRATDMDVTGTNERRGAGLHHVMERVRAYRGEMLIISGRGFLISKNGSDPVVDDLSADAETFHQGTVVLVALPVPASRAK